MAKEAKGSFLRKFLSKLGPGLVTGASDDDPSGIATYSQAGAQFGLVTLWVALLTFPLMTAIQEICARIGMVTSKGLTSIIKKHYSLVLLYILLLFTCPAIVLNIGADIAGMGAVTNLLIPAIPSYVFSIVFTIILLCIMVFASYKKVAMYLKYLCISLLVYLLVPFLVKQDWWAVLKGTFVPTIHFNKEFLNILVALLGTTISPYLFFWQATMEAEDQKHHQKKSELETMRIDVTVGMLFSNIVMYCIILTTGSVLFANGVQNIETVEQAAKALEPVAGQFCYFLFALGVIGTGLLSVPVLSATISYILAATFEVRSGLDKKYHEAKVFYGVISLSLLLGLCINLVGISPIKALIFTAIFYGVTAPVLIAIILLIANNKNIMGEKTNGLLSNILASIVLIMMTVAAVLMLYFQFV